MSACARHGEKKSGVDAVLPYVYKIDHIRVVVKAMGQKMAMVE